MVWWGRSVEEAVVSGAFYFKANPPPHPTPKTKTPDQFPKFVGLDVRDNMLQLPDKIIGHFPLMTFQRLLV